MGSERKLINQLNRLIIGRMHRDKPEIKVIRLDSKRYHLLSSYLQKYNLRQFGEDVFYRHRDGKLGRKFLNVDIKCEER